MREVAREAATPGSEAPCRAACPVGTDAAAYVALIHEGDLARAYDVARAPNPFPSICGRVCAAPCERSCRRGILDDAISIRALKRVICDEHGAEQGPASRWHRPLGDSFGDEVSEGERSGGERPAASSGPSVGIVGGGPAGLAAAHDLCRAGVPVTVYEATEATGGMMRWGIPPFRLPRNVLEAECDAIVGMGVELRTGCRIGEDEPFPALLERHAAVLVTVGCQRGRSLDVPGAREPGVIRAIDFLRGGAALGDGPVVVIGGGSVAFDAARSAWRAISAYDGQTALDAARRARRAGAARVTLVAPEAARDLPVPREELHEAEVEGVEVRGGEGVVRVVADERVTGVEVAPVTALRAPDGSFGPVLDHTRTRTLPAATVVLAIGQEADTDFLADVPGLERSPWGGIVADDAQRSSHSRIWAAGDVATGPRDLIDAIAAGRRAAASILEALPAEGTRRRALALAPGEREGVPTSPPLRQPTRFWSGYDRTPRTALPVLAPTDRDLLEEVERGLPPDRARTEASRCLRCDEQLLFREDRCIACGLCVDVCPQSSLALLPVGGAAGTDGGAAVGADGGAPAAAPGRTLAMAFHDESCIRCSLCVHRCPTDALAFQVAPAFRASPLAP